MSTERRQRTVRDLGLYGAGTALLIGAGVVTWHRHHTRRAANRRTRVSALGPRAEALASRLSSVGMAVTSWPRDPEEATLGERAVAEHSDLIIVDASAPDEALADLARIAARASLLVLDPHPSRIADVRSAWDERALLVANQVDTPLAYWALPPRQVLPGRCVILGETDGSSSLRLRQAAAVLGAAGWRVSISRGITGHTHLFWALRVVWHACLARNGSARRLVATADELAFCRSIVAEVLLLHKAAGLPDTASRASLVVPHQPAHPALAPMLAIGAMCARGAAPGAAEIRHAYTALLALGERSGFRTPLLSSLAPLYD